MPRVSLEEESYILKLRSGGMSYEEIAETLGRSKDTIQNKLRDIPQPVRRRPRTDKVARRQAKARMTPERACGPDPTVDLDPDLTREGDAKLGLIPEGAEQRMLEIRSGACICKTTGT